MHSLGPYYILDYTLTKLYMKYITPILDYILTEISNQAITTNYALITTN